MVVRWRFPIGGNYAWFESFAHRHGAGPDFLIIRDVEDDAPPAYAFASEHLEDLNDPRAVIDRAMALKALYDGALVVLYGRHHDPLQWLWDEQSRSSVPVGEADVLVPPFSEARVRRTDRASDREDAAIDPVSKWIYVARGDRIVRGLLSFFGVNGVSWITLYAALDYMKNEDWDEARIAAAAGVSKKEIVRFRRTANNEDVLGPYARHGAQGYEPPDPPMKLSEASEIMRRAAIAFLDQRAIDFELAKQA